jgi:protoporphyrinogen oxidase
MKIAIVGAGLTGMTAAWNLRKQGHNVTIFEKESNPGGLASGFREPQWQDSVEKFYHHIFKNDKDILGLVKELELTNMLSFSSPKSVMYHKEKFYPFDTIPAALLYPGLGFGFNKIRFGLVGLYLKIASPWKKLEQVTAHDWMIKYAGRSVYESMWEPMMIGKFGENYADKVNMAWLWARIHTRTTALGTFRGGFQAFIDVFAEKLRVAGVQFVFNQPVKQISKIADGSFTVSVNDSEENFDRVIVTTSPASFLSMVPEIPEDYRTKLLSLKSMGAVVMVISIKHPLSPDGYYWYNLPKSEGYPCLALVEHTNFVPKERFNGETILYAGDYLEDTHENFKLSKEELLKRIIPGLKKINPNFNESWINNFWKFSERYAQPIPFVNHSQNVPSIKTPIDGMILATMSHIYPWDRGTNYAVALGNEVSRLFL